MLSKLRSRLRSNFRHKFRHKLRLKPTLKSGQLRYFMITTSLLTSAVYGVPVNAAPFAQVKQVVFATPYAQLPNYQVHKKHFGKAGNGENNALLSAAKRTLNDPRDLIEFPQQQKLLQANGICFVGEWLIESQASDSSDNSVSNGKNAYTGLFSAGTRTKVIARASVALSGTRQKDKRAFGMAIKFFNTSSTTEKLHPA